VCEEDVAKLAKVQDTQTKNIYSAIQVTISKQDTFDMQENGNFLAFCGQVCADNS